MESIESCKSLSNTDLTELSIKSRGNLNETKEACRETCKLNRRDGLISYTTHSREPKWTVCRKRDLCFSIFSDQRTLLRELGVARRNLWIHPTVCTNVPQQEPMAAIIYAHHVEWSSASQLNRHHADNWQISIRASQIGNKAIKSEVFRTVICSVYMSLGSHWFQLAENCFWKRSQLGAG